MAQSTPPFRAEHVGSLLRPLELRQAFRAFTDGRIGADDFRSIQDEAVRQVVERQQDVGLQVVTDGEFRRKSYWAHFVEAVDGLDVAWSRFEFHDDASKRQRFLAPVVTGPVRRTRAISGDEFDFLRSVSQVTPKVTMPSPPTMHFWADPEAPSTAGYVDTDVFFDDLTAVYRAELADLAARGATYIQIDEVPLAMLCDPDLRGRLEADGERPDVYVRRYVELINACLADRPPGLTVGIHLCRGNFKGMWLADGGYDYVAEGLFRDVAANAFFLEFDTERAGGFQPLAAIPDDRYVVLGLVSTKTPVLEDVDTLLRRLEEAAEFVPLDRLALSPQCGFASTVGGNPVTEDDQFAKLRRIVEVATEVWGDPGPAGRSDVS